MNPRICPGELRRGKIPWCFNGAAGVNPRIYVATVEALQVKALLQWGRGCEPADITLGVGCVWA